MARASTYTLLALDRYAKILGIAPPNFNQATCDPFFMGSGCQEIFWQHAWQSSDRVSREDLAEAIQSAETDLANAVGFPLAPTWVYEEVNSWPRFYRSEVYGTTYNVRDQRISLKAKYYKIIGGGRRGSTLIQANVVPTYSDADGDGLLETATVSCATTQTQAKEIKVYFAGHTGQREWEIRPCRTKAIAGGTFTATFYTWQFINPDLWEEYPETGVDPVPIDISGNPPANVVRVVDVYREYNDHTVTSAQFYWEPKPEETFWSLNCGTEGAFATQDGVLMVRDPETGHVIPAMATYDATTDTWATSCLAVGREPDLVKMWYQAGDIDQDYLAGRSFDPLSDYWARNIAMVATARLGRTLCGCECGEPAKKFTLWQTDLAFTKNGEGRMFDYTLLDNPLGTHYGEVEVWKKIKRNDMYLGGAAVG